MGDRKQKPWRKPLDKEWAQALLTGPVHDSLREAKETYEAAVEAARKALAEHPFMELVAQEAARRAGKRGDPRIIVDDTGQVVLEIRYGVPSKTTKVGLPTLTELRKKADEAGVDISDLGRAKRKILARLEGVGKTPKRKAKKKMRKTAPAVSPVRLVSVQDPDPPPGSMAALAAKAVKGVKGAKSAENINEFLATLDDIDD